MPPSNDQDIPESTYPVLIKPTFESQIPEPLLEGASPADRYIMEQLSKLSQFADWSVNAHLSTDSSVRKTNGRLIRAERNVADLQKAEDRVIWSWKTLAKVGAGLGGLACFIYYIVNIASCSGAVH